MQEPTSQIDEICSFKGAGTRNLTFFCIIKQNRTVEVQLLPFPLHYRTEKVKHLKQIYTIN